MMKAAYLRHLNDPAAAHDLTLHRALLSQREMRARFVVIAKVRGQVPLQRASVQDDAVVQALPSYRADQSLRVSVLPGTLFNTQRLELPSNVAAVHTVAIPDQVPRRNFI